MLVGADFPCNQTGRFWQLLTTSGSSLVPVERWRVPVVPITMAVLPRRGAGLCQVGDRRAFRCRRIMGGGSLGFRFRR